MESIFEKVFYILTELGMMQDFINFTKNVHKLSRCDHNDCEVEHVGIILRAKKSFFTEACINNVSVFNAMFNLHHKGKENVNKIKDLIEDPSAVLERQIKRHEELMKFIREKHLIKKKIGAIVEYLFLNK